MPTEVQAGSGAINGVNLQSLDNAKFVAPFAGTDSFDKDNASTAPREVPESAAVPDYGLSVGNMMISFPTMTSVSLFMAIVFIPSLTKLTAGRSPCPW